MISVILFKMGKHSDFHLSFFQIVSAWRDFTVVTKLMKIFKSLYGFRGRLYGFWPCFKVHNLVSVHPKSIILGQMINLDMIFHVVVSVYRLVKIWNSHQFPVEFRNGLWIGHWRTYAIPRHQCLLLNILNNDHWAVILFKINYLRAVPWKKVFFRLFITFVYLMSALSSVCSFQMGTLKFYLFGQGRIQHISMGRELRAHRGRVFCFDWIADWRQVKLL